MPKTTKAKKSTKKKVTEAAKTTFAATLDALPAVAHTNCFTDPTKGQRWSSKIGAAKDPDGAFYIGDGPSFQGTHSHKGYVSGKCLGNGMQIRTDDGAFLYTGTYTDSGMKKIKGQYFSIGLLEMNLAAGNPLPPGEPWEADKET